MNTVIEEFSRRSDMLCAAYYPYRKCLGELRDYYEQNGFYELGRGFDVYFSDADGAFIEAAKTAEFNKSQILIHGKMISYADIGRMYRKVSFKLSELGGCLERLEMWFSEAGGSVPRKYSGLDKKIPEIKALAFKAYEASEAVVKKAGASNSAMEEQSFE